MRGKDCSAQCSPLKPLETENKINDAVFPVLPKKPHVQRFQSCWRTPAWPCAGCPASPQPLADGRRHEMLKGSRTSRLTPTQGTRAVDAAHPQHRLKGAAPRAAAGHLGHGTNRVRGGRAACPWGTRRSQQQIKGMPLAACLWKVPAHSSQPNLLTSSCLQSSSPRLA